MIKDNKKTGIFAGDLFNKNPMLRLAFPLMAGIAFSCFLSVNLLLVSFLFFVALVVACFAMGKRAPWWLFGVSVVLSMFALGMVVEQSDREEQIPCWSGEKGCFEAVLLEVPHVGARSTKVRAHVTRIGRDSVQWARREGVVNIYCANSVEAERLHIGERIFFEGKVLPPMNAGNPAEFDMERYMYVNGITGNVYLPIDGWQSLGDTELSLPMYALVLREKLVKVYNGLGFDEEERSVLSAFTVGEKRVLTENLRELYATAGASHLLALSGLHLGIFYMIITFLLPVRAGNRRLVILRELLAVLLLWGFALVAGLSASVVRAAILFTLISVARCLQRDNSSMNALAFAVIVMLVAVPRWLFDVSFQLSFSAVAAILLLQKPFSRILNVDTHGGCYKLVAEVIAISVSAQLGTFPFVWYYFGTFPLYFMLTNFVAIPVAFIVMLLSVFLLAVTPIVQLQQLVALVIDFLLRVLNDFLRLVAEIPYASLELPYVGLTGVILVTVALWLFLYALLNWKKRLMIISFFSFVIVVSGLFFMRNTNEEPYILFYNSRECPVAQVVYSKENSFLFTSYPEWDMELEYTVEPYCRRYGISVPQLLNDGFFNDRLAFEDNILHFAERKIKMLDDDCWQDETAVTPVDCIFLCRGFKGPIKELMLRYPSRYVIMDATLYAGSRRRIVRECAELNIRCIDLTKGAVKLLCNKTGVRFENMRGK